MACFKKGSTGSFSDDLGLLWSDVDNLIETMKSQFSAVNVLIGGISDNITHGTDQQQFIHIVVGYAVCISTVINVFALMAMAFYGRRCLLRLEQHGF